MTSIVIFSASGLAIILLLATKRLELKNKQDFFILDIISKGNIHIRKLYHRIVSFYFKSKEQIFFFIYKQLPVYYRKSFNKLLTFIEKKREQYLVSMRDSRLLKKPDGLSEFFKNMSDIEKGNGEIHDIYESDSQEQKNEVK
jgi:hypothetical protein